MSEITPDLVRHLANLARIDVTDQEVDLFAGQLGLIVEPSLTQAPALSAAPDSADGRFRVHAILDEE